MDWRNFLRLCYDFPNMIPSRQILLEAEQLNLENGHELAGFLSEAAGFLPRSEPLQCFPASHRVWDDVAAALPELFQRAALREKVDAMPVLSGAEQDLDATYIQRALTVLGILAHAYYRLEGRPAELPASIMKPWQEVCRRAGREGVFLCFYDIFFYNWKYRDPAKPLRRVDHLELMVRTVPHQGEKYIALTIVETMDHAAPMIGAMVRAQEAVVAEDVTSLKRELIAITRAIRLITEAFEHINLNPLSHDFSDPVATGKCISIMWEPIPQENSTGVGGTETPFVHLIDAFIGRGSFATVYGEDQLHKQRQAPPHVQKFLKAIAKISVKTFVEQQNDQELKGVFCQLIESFIGDKGLLQVHLLKAYGYMATGMRVGRLGAIEQSTFTHRLWNVSGEHLFEAMEERKAEFRHLLLGTRLKPSSVRKANEQDSSSQANTVVFDTRHTGMEYRPGDCLSLTPLHDDAIIDKTMNALRAGPQTLIRLNKAWRVSGRLHDGKGATPEKVPLRDFLRHASLRPVSRAVLQSLYALTADPDLKQIMDEHREDQWELWDLIELVARRYEVCRFWQSDPWLPENLSNILPPEHDRIYSIASAYDPERVSLLVGRLHYQTNEQKGCPLARQGTASGFMSRLTPDDPSVAARHQRKNNFSLPESNSTPVIMLAGGTGLAPFLGFLQQRIDRDHAGDNWLLYGVRHRDDICHADQLETWLKDGRLRLNLAFSGEDLAVKVSPDGLAYGPGNRERIDAAMLRDEVADDLWSWINDREAIIYVCGGGPFASSMMKAFLGLFARRLGDAQAADQYLRNLHANRRYRQDIYTTFAPSASGVDSYRGYPLSEIVRHNNPEQGYWIIIDDEVYDMTEFIHLHPGGDTLITNSAGSDATAEYRTIRHHLDPGIQAVLSMYKIGFVKQIDLGRHWGLQLKGDQLDYVPLSSFYRAVAGMMMLAAEMENAHAAEVRYYNQAIPTAQSGRFALQSLGDYLSNLTYIYINGLLDRNIIALWRMTVGLCSPSSSFFEAERRISVIKASGSYARLAGLAGQFADHRTAIDAEQVLDLYRAIREQHEELLGEIKSLWREGIVCFERHESRVITNASTELAALTGRHLDTVGSRIDRMVERIDAAIPAT